MAKWGSTVNLRRKNPQPRMSQMGYSRQSQPVLPFDVGFDLKAT